jgi:hypothetical protein
VFGFDLMIPSGYFTFRLLKCPKLHCFRLSMMTRWQAACQEHHDCSDVGNAFVQYADALVAQVQSHQITEADAMVRFAEYKTKLISDQQRNAAIVGAGIAASGPHTCTAVGNTVNCF